MLKAILTYQQSNTNQILEELIQAHSPELTVIASLNTKLINPSAISYLQPDVVFFDLDSPSQNIKELLDLPQRRFESIFLISPEQYQKKAIQLSGLNFLIKPLNPKQLTKCLSHIIQTKKESQNIVDSKNQPQVAHSTADKFLTVANQDKIVFLNKEDILFLKAERAYTRIITACSNFIASKPLKEFELLLKQHSFFRPHRSFLINLSKVKGFVKKDGGYILMQDETQISLAQSKKEIFFHMFGIRNKTIELT